MFIRSGRVDQLVNCPLGGRQRPLTCYTKEVKQTKPMTTLTAEQKQNLIDLLVECSYEDSAFLTNRIAELVELDGPALYETWAA